MSVEQIPAGRQAWRARVQRVFVPIAKVRELLSTKRRHLCSVMLLFLLPLSALADGMVFRPIAVPVECKIPDQRALIHFTNGVERLVIETRFTGSGTNFAWVVPLPATPIIEAATPGLFPTLEHLFQPRLTHQVTRYYLAILAFLGLGYILAFVRIGRRIHWLDFLACAVVAACAGLRTGESAAWAVGAVVFLTLLLSIVAVRVGSRLALMGFWALVLLMVVESALFLPVLAPAGTKAMGQMAGASEGVSVLDRRLVGAFETTTLSSREPRALQTWLRENGYAVSKECEPVIENYVREGWVFVATKLGRESAGSETSTPHPLSFTFKTDRPVYPMRLTGVENGPLDVELYVFGPARARAAHFNVRRCVRPNYPERPSPDTGEWSFFVPETPNILHPLLRNWVEGAPVVTRLTATLSRAEMREDVWIDWKPYAEKKDHRFSRSGASVVGMNLTSALFGVALLGVGICVGMKPVLKATGRKWIALAAAISVGVGATTYLALPKIQVRLVRRIPRESYYNLLSWGFWLADDEPAKSTELRSEFKQLLSTNKIELNRSDPNAVRLAQFAEMINPLSGGRIQEEDSPGNYVLEEKNGLIVLFGFDAEGARHGINTWNLKP